MTDLDGASQLIDNHIMKNGETKDDMIPPEVMADAQLIADCAASGNPVPPEVARRVRDRSEIIRQRVFAEHGLLDIGVPAIRELRGELPKP